MSQVIWLSSIGLRYKVEIITRFHTANKHRLSMHKFNRSNEVSRVPHPLSLPDNHIRPALSRP